MSSATYTLRRNQNLYRTPAKLRLGPVSIGFLTIASIVVLSLLYLAQITKTNVYGNRLSELKTERKQIADAKQAYEVEAARLQSIQTIQASPVVAKLVPEGSAVYATAR